jgi:hypothetical protein
VSAAFTRAYGAKDWGALRDLLAEDAVFSDHRAFGFGAFVGELVRDAWIESVVAFHELAPDFDIEPFRTLAWSPHGSVAMARITGTLRDGGPFEHVLIVLHASDGKRITRFEAFDVGDAERALARFEELCCQRP